MALQELSDLLELIQESLDELEFRLSELLGLARSNRHQFLVRCTREVATASASLVHLEAERVALVSALSIEYGLSPLATLTDIYTNIESPWQEIFESRSRELRASAERISGLQGEVRAVCEQRMNVFEAALTLVGGQAQTYGAKGALHSVNSRVLSESL